jgi:RNA polymerase sigma factor for flagellar operon FliA
LGDTVVLQKPEDPPGVLERFASELDLVQLVAAQVRRSVGAAIEFDDMLSAGREGLLDAARRFDESRGVPFRAYANLRIKGAVIDALRRHTSLSRDMQRLLGASEAICLISEGKLSSTFDDSQPSAVSGAGEQQYASQLASMATASALALSARSNVDSWAVPSDPSESPEDQVSRAEVFDLIRQGIDELDFVEAAVVRAYYFEGRSFGELATDLNMSRSWACRLHSQAMERLTKRVRGLV